MNVLVAGIIVLVAIAGVTGAGWATRQALAVNGLARGVGQTSFYGADGRFWFTLDEHRRDVPLESISPHLQRAVIAIEDHRFFRHPGIDPIGIGRSMVENVRSGTIRQGGSTLTQQLARTVFLSNARTWNRKLKEIVLALMIERRLSKQQILELYLNRIYLGGTVYGVEAMAQNLYGKSAADLTLAESAFIAGLIRMPSGLSPWSHYERAWRRTQVVLARMRQEGFISAEMERAAAEHPPRILPKPGLAARGGGYAAAYLRQQFRDRFGGENPPDWKVQTSFVPEIQREAERAVAEGLQRLGVPDLQAALVALDPHTGDVLALVGGRDFGTAPFNRAVEAKRQPGSAFKPLLFASALDSGLSPVSVLTDLDGLSVPGHDEWVVRNASTDGRDRLTLRDALVESNNRAAVRLQSQIGSQPVLRLAHDVGLRDMPDVPSLALGAGDVTPLALTAAFATFANGGLAVGPRAIVRVIDRRGSVAVDAPVERRRVLSEAAAFQMLSMLSEVIERGTAASAASLGVRFPAAGKTGTTNEFKDAWFVGFTSSVVAGVWVGFDRPAPIAPDGYGSRYALPLWAEFMTRVARLRPPEELRPPPSLQPVALGRTTGLRATAQCNAYSEYFKPGDELPADDCHLHRAVPTERRASAAGGFLGRLGRGFKRIFGR